MDHRSKGQLFEAVIAAGPATLAITAGYPVLLYQLVRTYADTPGDHALTAMLLTGGLWALLEFWRIVLATVARKAYAFNARFWLAIASFFACFVRFVPDMPAGLMLLLMVLPALAWTHFIVLQIKRPRDL
ncbi:hypothetical protein [Janthinobacterium sp. LB2P10]|uniref:hypothetical protein n=1 Tax=Janthinobacterium sp. LB2P10 TaxID=3424194 RepID=UPI003F2366CE